MVPRPSPPWSAADKPEGVIVATPNQVHVENGLECVAAGVPVLVEKPIADDVASAIRLVEAAEARGVPLLVGHHRRHNPMIQAAKRAIEAGRLGAVLAVHGFCWFFKPDDYFDVSWRREKGAGPVLVNLIHDVDNLRYLCGEIVAVHAFESNAVRKHAVEETAVIALRFSSGVLGTVNGLRLDRRALELGAHHGREPRLPPHAGVLLPDRRHARLAHGSLSRPLAQRREAQLVGAGHGASGSPMRASIRCGCRCSSSARGHPRRGSLRWCPAARDWRPCAPSMR